MWSSPPPARLIAAILLILLPALGGPVRGEDPAQLVARGDEAWVRRALGSRGPVPLPEPIGEAVAAFGAALEVAPDDLEIRVKLLRALYFQGEFQAAGKEAKLTIFTRARSVADDGCRQVAMAGGIEADIASLAPAEVAAAVAGVPAAAGAYFWAAVHWGTWARYRGKLAAARAGVASKIRRFAEISILLDETVEGAGGHRVLGRLHSEAPKVPFFTLWVDRDRAVAELRRSLELAPRVLLTRLYLVEALLEHHPEFRDEALELLHDLVGRAPDPRFLIEDRQALEDARALLAELEG